MVKHQGYFGLWGLWGLFHSSIPEDSVNKHIKRKIDNRLRVLGKGIAHENQKKNVILCSSILQYGALLHTTVKGKIWKDI